jgi:hypothetical protein
MTIQTERDAFSFVAVGRTVGSTRSFSGHSRHAVSEGAGVRVAAETGRAELQTIGILLGPENSKNRTHLLEVLNARLSFAVLQVRDLLTTLFAFHFGAFEINPDIA